MDDVLHSPDNGWKRFTFIEPAIFLIFVAYGMTGIVFSDLILFQTCRKILKENDNCNILHTNSSSQAALNLDKLIQPVTSYILMYQSLLEGFSTAFFSLFFGPWSDKYGRRPLLLIGYTASTCKLILLSILTLWNMNPWFFLFASIPSGLLGGISGTLLGTFCYITDITTSKERALRLAWLQASIYGGLIIGTLIGPGIFRLFGYYALFSSAATISSVSLLHTYFHVPETIKNNTQQKWKYLFDLKNVKDLITTSTKKRSGLNRTVLWSCILILSLHVVLMDGHGNIGFLFVSAKLGWNETQYSIYSSATIIVSIIGTISTLKILKKYFGFSDTSVALIGALSSFSSAMILSFTWKFWHMCVAIFVGALNSVISPTIQSILSTLVPSQDTGKVFCLTTFMQNLMPLGGNFLYSLIYSAYMPPVYPLPAYLLSGGILAIVLLLIILVDTQTRKHDQPLLESSDTQD